MFVSLASSRKRSASDIWQCRRAGENKDERDRSSIVGRKSCPSVEWGGMSAPSFDVLGRCLAIFRDRLSRCQSPNQQKTTAAYYRAWLRCGPCLTNHLTQMSCPAVVTCFEYLSSRAELAINQISYRYPGDTKMRLNPYGQYLSRPTLCRQTVPGT